jgi:hypothetical protein
MHSWSVAFWIQELSLYHSMSSNRRFGPLFKYYPRILIKKASSSNSAINSGTAVEEHPN